MPTQGGLGQKVKNQKKYIKKINIMINKGNPELFPGTPLFSLPIAPAGGSRLVLLLSFFLPLS